MDEATRTRLPSLSTVLKATWRIYTRAYDGIFLVLLLVQLPIAVAVELIDRAMRPGAGGVPLTIGDLLASWSLQGLLDVAFGIVGTMAVCHLAAQAALGRRVTPLAALRAAVGRWSTGTRTTLIQFLGQGLGLVLFILPGIYLAVRWVFVPAAIMVGGSDVTGSLRESASLVSSRWWAIGGRILALAGLPLLAWVVLGIATIRMTPECFLQSVSVGFLVSVCLSYSWVGITLLYMELKEIA